MTKYNVEPPISAPNNDLATAIIQIIIWMIMFSSGLMLGVAL